MDEHEYETPVATLRLEANALIAQFENQMNRTTNAKSPYIACTTFGVKQDEAENADYDILPERSSVELDPEPNRELEKYKDKPRVKGNVYTDPPWESSSEQKQLVLHDNELENNKSNANLTVNTDGTMPERSRERPKLEQHKELESQSSKDILSTNDNGRMGDATSEQASKQQPKAETYEVSDNFEPRKRKFDQPLPPLPEKAGETLVPVPQPVLQVPGATKLAQQPSQISDKTFHEYENTRANVALISVKDPSDFNQSLVKDGQSSVSNQGLINDGRPRARSTVVYDTCDPLCISEQSGDIKTTENPIPSTPPSIGKAYSKQKDPGKSNKGIKYEKDSGQCERIKKEKDFRKNAGNFTVKKRRGEQNDPVVTVTLCRRMIAFYIFFFILGVIIGVALALVGVLVAFKYEGNTVVVKEGGSLLPE